MDPSELGLKYDKIAQWWYDQHRQSSYGVQQVKRAVDYASDGGQALDVGCGAGGRVVKLLQDRGFSVTGLDVSIKMVELARRHHPDCTFLQEDISTWNTDQKFDFIVAWDSLFHLPLASQEAVIAKLCGLLAKDGILIYTFGNAEGEHTDQWRNDSFYYSSIGINQNLQVLIDNELAVLHLELDQYPEKHVYLVATKS